VSGATATGLTTCGKSAHLSPIMTWPELLVPAELTINIETS
jgi:hypothetical protein